MVGSGKFTSTRSGIPPTAFRIRFLMVIGRLLSRGVICVFHHPESLEVFLDHPVSLGLGQHVNDAVIPGYGELRELVGQEGRQLCRVERPAFDRYERCLLYTSPSPRD